MAKFGNIKRQHGRIEGLDALLDRIVKECPYVTRIVPGRLGRKRGNTKPLFRIKYATGGGGGGDDENPTSLKCIYTRAGSWQEVFLICSDTEAAAQWLKKNKIAPKS